MEQNNLKINTIKNYEQILSNDKVIINSDKKNNEIAISGATTDESTTDYMSAQDIMKKYEDLIAKENQSPDTSLKDIDIEREIHNNPPYEKEYNMQKERKKLNDLFAKQSDLSSKELDSKSKKELASIEKSLENSKNKLNELQKKQEEKIEKEYSKFPTMKQISEDSCWIASSQLVTEFLNNKKYEDKLVLELANDIPENKKGNAEGIALLLKLLDDTVQTNLKVGLLGTIRENKNLIKQSLDSSKLVILGLPGHAIVAIGYSKDKILISDPSTNSKYFVDDNIVLSDFVEVSSNKLLGKK